MFLGFSQGFVSSVSNLTAKADSAPGFIRRNMLASHAEVKATAYKQLVWPTTRIQLGSTGLNWQYIRRTISGSAEKGNTTDMWNITH